MGPEDASDLKVSALVKKLVDSLTPLYGNGEAKAIVRLIFHSLKGWNATDLIVNGDREASEFLLEKIKSAVDRILAGEPVQYVLGESRFYGMDILTDRRVLIPRQETEELVEAIIKENPEKDLRVLDVGTGSGAIAIALARNLKFPEVTAIDISKDALDLAKENASRLHARIKFEQADIFDYMPAPDTFDIIVSNPPYIAESEKEEMEANVLDFEPSLALFVPDENPLIYYSRISEAALTGLKRGGKLYFEINPRFASDLQSMLSQEGFSDVRILEDISHKKRFAIARKP